LMGIPLLMPWILYRNHVDHHSSKYFGTVDDGEYLPLARSPLSETVKYLVQAPLLPLLSIVRFGILGPISVMHPRLRELVLTAASAAVINPHYRKRFPKRDERHLQTVEVLCFLYIAAITALLVRNVISWHQLGLAYLLLAWTLSLNWVRTLGAHRYNNDGGRRSYLEQFADSLNITGQSWLTTLMFPVGLRYHALHHLFPSLPYHSLGEAHRRLSARLPPDAPYHATGCDSLIAALADLLSAARRTSAEESAMRRWRRKPGAP
jgi:fatty acid desaturase